MSLWPGPHCNAAAIDEIFEARLALETLLMARLCRDLRPEALARARWLAAALERVRPDDPGRSLLEQDAAFHCHLYAAAGNPIAAEMLQRGWSDLLRLWAGRRLERAALIDWSACRRRRVQQHERLLDALARGDAAAVHTETVHHIRSDQLEMKSLRLAQ